MRVYCLGLGYELGRRDFAEPVSKSVQVTMEATSSISGRLRALQIDQENRLLVGEFRQGLGLGRRIEGLADARRRPAAHPWRA